MASSSTNIVLCTYDEIYFVGNMNNQNVGSKLPSVNQTLIVLFYNLKHIKLNFQECARLVSK